MAANTANTAKTASAVQLDEDLFDQAFEPTFGPFEPISGADRERMSQEFTSSFPALSALLESGRTAA